MTNKGQALTEYGLAIFALLSVSLVGLMVFSSTLNGIFSSMMPHASVPQAVDVANIPALSASVPVQQAMHTQNALQANINDQLPKQHSESAITARDTQESIQVSGANGATKALATILMAEAQQLLDAGNISASQYQQLFSLANQGFVLADAQKLLEDALHDNKPTVTYQGKTYATLQFASLFGINAPSDTQWDLSPQYGAPLMKPFLEQYQTVLESGTFQTPAMEKTVSSLSYQIAAIGDALEWNLYKMAGETQSPVPMDVRNASLAKLFLLDLEDAEVGDLSASAKTQKNSIGICNAGKGNSGKGKNCTQKED